jgi:tetratricopeptide (TPR) repeat protein
MNLDPRNPGTLELQGIEAQASLFMKRGIRLLAAGESNATIEALALFDRALDLRRRLPFETVPRFGYGLAACWLNRAEALMQLQGADVDRTSLAIRAYDEAIRLLRKLPLHEDVRFPRRLAIAYQNRGLVLHVGHSNLAGARAAFLEAIAVLNDDCSVLIPDRQYLLGAIWLNVANACASVSDVESTAIAQNAARRALALVADLEAREPSAAEVGLKARHVLCQTLVPVLSHAIMNGEVMPDDVHDATDAADEGLGLVRQWERAGIVRFRDIANDLFAFGTRVYARFQPHFLDEFVRDNSEFAPKALTAKAR